MAADGGDAVALLHLAVLSAQSLKDVNFLGRTKTSAVAWVDPRYRASTKTLHVSGRNSIWNQTLLLPLSEQTLRNPDSRITVQVLCSSSKVLGSATLALSSVLNEGNIFTLQLHKSPSGKPRGLLTVSPRIVWNFVVGVPVQGEELAPEFRPVAPTAPPLPAPVMVPGENKARNFLIGMISGAVAALLVGAAVV